MFLYSSILLEIGGFSTSLASSTDQGYSSTRLLLEIGVVLMSFASSTDLFGNGIIFTLSVNDAFNKLNTMIDVFAFRRIARCFRIRVLAYVKFSAILQFFRMRHNLHHCPI